MTALAKKAGLSLRMIVDYEKDYCLYEPSEQTIASFVDVLKYPADFFFGEDIESIDPSTVSFRSLKKMTSAQEGAAIGAGIAAVHRPLVLPAHAKGRVRHETRWLPNGRPAECWRGGIPAAA